MSVAANQKRIFLRLLAALQPHWRMDPALPARIQALLARDRSFGSRDRRLYRELIYTTLRHLPWIEPLLDGDPDDAVRLVAWLAADLPATHAFRAAFASGPPPTGRKEELLPGWFRGHCAAIFSGRELEAQLRRAPLWLRLQTANPQSVFDEFDHRGWHWRASTALPNAVELRDEVDVTQSSAWRDGQVEVQDLGSQMILAAVTPGRNEWWLDACAGAGGKTLQLARLLGPHGHVTAHDVRGSALQELRRRAARAAAPCEPVRTVTPPGNSRPSSFETGYAPIALSSAPPTGSFDGVLVDAPCSGSGTWRRAPHLKWISSEAAVARAAVVQERLLAHYATLVRPGGRLVYATCSLSSLENEAVAGRFLDRHPHFRAEPLGSTFGAEPRGPGILILPGLHDSDGFYVASLRHAASLG